MRPRSIPRIETFAVILVLLMSAAPITAQPAEKVEVASRNEALVSKIWWNQEPKIQELGLTKAQRQTLDKILRDFLIQRRGQDQEQQAVLDAFGKALANDDQDSARSLASEFAQNVGGPAMKQMNMMTEAVSHLTDAQRSILQSKYPLLLSRLWIRSSNPRSGMLRRSRRGGPGP